MPAKWMQDALAAQEAGEKTAKKPPAKATKDKPRKGGADRKRPAKAPVAPPAEVSGELVRLIFPCSPTLSARITAYWHKEELGSKSETIRVLIERGLGGALLEKAKP